MLVLMGTRTWNIACPCGYRWITKTDDDKVRCPKCRNEVVLKGEK
jgi:DNA-directed RNA polymerase subunit RPC12/RpoP